MAAKRTTERAAFTADHAEIAATVQSTLLDIHLERNPNQLAQLTTSQRHAFNLAIAAVAIRAEHSDTLRRGLAGVRRVSPDSVRRALRSMPDILADNPEARIRWRMAVARLLKVKPAYGLAVLAAWVEMLERPDTDNPAPGP